MTWVAVGVMVASTAAKAYSDKKTNDKQRQLTAKTQEYSPWTGMQAQMPAGNPVTSDVLQGAGAAVSAYGNAQSQQAQLDQTKAFTNKLNSQAPSNVNLNANMGATGNAQQSPWAQALGKYNLYGTSDGMGS